MTKTLSLRSPGCTPACLWKLYNIWQCPSCLAVLCVSCRVAQVASIREAAAKTLQKIAKEFGPEWAREHLVPQVLGMIKNPHYLYRMTMLQAISMLASIVSTDVLVSQMLPVILNASKDKVRAPHTYALTRHSRVCFCEAQHADAIGHPSVGARESVYVRASVRSMWD